MIVASAQGGMDIETVAAKDPMAIIKAPIDIVEGLKESTARDVASRVGFKGKSLDMAVKEMMNLYKLFIKVRQAEFASDAKAGRCGTTANARADLSALATLALLIPSSSATVQWWRLIPWCSWTTGESCAWTPS